MVSKTAYHSIIIDVATGQGKEATITVYDAGTLNLSTIYSDPDGTAKSNPFDTDENGRFSFYADLGEYDIEVSGYGIETYTLEDETIHVPSRNVIRTEPSTGEYLFKKLRIDSDGKTIIWTQSSAAEP